MEHLLRNGMKYDRHPDKNYNRGHDDGPGKMKRLEIDLGSNDLGTILPDEDRERIVCKMNDESRNEAPRTPRQIRQIRSQHGQREGLRDTEMVQTEYDTGKENTSPDAHASFGLSLYIPPK